MLGPDCHRLEGQLTVTLVRVPVPGVPCLLFALVPSPQASPPDLGMAPSFSPTSVSSMELPQPVQN